MSKAEDLAKELFPLLETDKIGNNPYITYNAEQLAKQEGFVKGYRQAEKDLELTWMDIREILFAETDVEIDHARRNLKGRDIEFFMDILSRFNEQRKGK